MYQTFDIQSDNSRSADRVAALRQKMAAANIDGYLIPRADEFQGENVPPGAERLAWISGFTGSAGLALILPDKAFIFVDGRYTLQAPAQVDPRVFEIVDMTKTPPAAWLAENFDGSRLGFDPWLHTISGIVRLGKSLAGTQATLVAVHDNLVDGIWDDQPSPPAAPVRRHGMEFAGEEAVSKLARVQAALFRQQADFLVLNEPDSVAWLLNIRGSDIPHNPVPLCWAIVPATGPVDLYIDAEKVPAAIQQYLEDVARIRSPSALLPDLTEHAAAQCRIQLDPDAMAEAVRLFLADHQCLAQQSVNPCRALKAIKNEAELAGMRAAHLADGVAMVKFLHWFDRTGRHGDEIGSARHLENCRRAAPGFTDISFETISGSGPNGAITHYRVDTNTNRQIDPNSLYLVDSGGQYASGTTDITRTVATGVPDAEMKRLFTLVLKGHIAIARARFPAGTHGGQLDPLARWPLWQAGVDFNHGTGHGVGAHLSVHEGPISISKRPSPPFEPGMVLSNEPGYYRPHHWGIRIENLLVVTVPAPVEGGDIDMLGFEDITLCPIDRRLVSPELLSDAELHWLNAYHQRVRSALIPLLDAAADRQWLIDATEEIGV